jgi:mannosyltransferase OCH1-like enzyme
MTIPKKIWFLWYQGLAEAPLVVKKCYESWQKYNPDWEVIFLDENNLKDYITHSLPPEKLSQLSKNHQSDLLRVELLAKYGGVWVDATCLCQIPLDEWLENYNQAGFFAFVHRTRGIGWIASWFMAAEKSNPIVVKMAQKFSAFYAQNEFYHSGTVAKKRIKFLEKILNRKYKTTRFWSSWLISKTFKVYPYFIFHFIFAKLINSDRELFQIYKKMKPYYNPGDDLGKYGLLRPLTPEIKERIDSRIDPVHKLSWKYKQENYSSASVLHYLLEEAD